MKQKVQRCPFCRASDHMSPFSRSDRVPLLSRLLPRVRWRYCRRCARHFIVWRSTDRRSSAST
jgi:hypothetical protein